MKLSEYQVGMTIHGYDHHDHPVVAVVKSVKSVCKDYKIVIIVEWEDGTESEVRDYSL